MSEDYWPNTVLDQIEQIPADGKAYVVAFFKEENGDRRMSLCDLEKVIQWVLEKHNLIPHRHVRMLVSVQGRDALLEKGFIACAKGSAVDDLVGKGWAEEVEKECEVHWTQPEYRDLLEGSIFAAHHRTDVLSNDTV